MGKMEAIGVVAEELQDTRRIAGKERVTIGKDGRETAADQVNCQEGGRLLFNRRNAPEEGYNSDKTKELLLRLLVMMKGIQ